MEQRADHADRGAGERAPTARQLRPGDSTRRRVLARHLAIPAGVSALLLVIFFPLILRLDPGAYAAATGRSPDRYLRAWLLLTAGLFLASALAWVLRTARRRRRGRPARDDATRPRGAG